MTCSRNHSIKKYTTEIPEFMTPNANLLTVQNASIPQQISIRDHSAITIKKIIQPPSLSKKTGCLL